MDAEKKVMIAVDASEQAEYALHWYLDHIHKPNNYVILTHCAEPPALPAFTFREGLAIPADEWKKVVAKAHEQIKKLEEDYMQQLIQAKIKHKVRTELGHGKAGEGIIKIAEEENADMIVMGTRGLGTFRRTVMGSVSDYVVHHANIPVCIVPCKKK